ncbi:MAG TPA: ribonucleoside-diphosphate reductase subunit alpha [Myxococcota bacterium]|nr:ribonucleoside-diphosphate reductase subunit alpha [Myxococcota bacterium]
MANSERNDLEQTLNHLNNLSSPDYASFLISRFSQGLKIDINEALNRFAMSAMADMQHDDVLDVLIRQAASRIVEEPDYGVLARKLLHRKISLEVARLSVHSFSDAVTMGFQQGMLTEKIFSFVMDNQTALDQSIDVQFNDLFTYFGLATVYDRYLLRHPINRKVFELPQYLFMRVACGIYSDLPQIIELYRLMASFSYMAASPTLFNAGTKNPQLSSCFLVDSPNDSIEGIYRRYTDVAKLSKHGGGIGISYSRVRSRGSLIRGTNGRSSGISPWLKTLDSSVAAVNQGGRRKGACCVYLETWHADIETFLELRDSTGDEAQRTHNLNLANWVPDLFMKRVRDDAPWSLFDPSRVPELCDTYGDDFERIYQQAEKDLKFERQISARDLYARMMKTLAQTGNGWMTFKDACNKKSNQTGHSGQVIHLSNLCTEILEVSSDSETAVCNLGSINLMRHVNGGAFDFAKLAQTVTIAIRQLNQVIDATYYPIEEAAHSNKKWRPVGLGVMGLQDVLFALRIPFDSSDARALSQKIAEEIYFQALKVSADLAEEQGHHETFPITKAAAGMLQCDLWGHEASRTPRFLELKERIKRVGLRNSLLIAIAPTATIASIVGCYECIEPQLSNIFKRETLSGEFLQINHYLVKDLSALNLWNEAIRQRIVDENGSIANIEEIPEDLRLLYRTTWELPQKALIDLALARGPFIDQSQSLNLFMETPNIGKLSSMYFYAWQSGLKTCYYLRSRPATQIAKTKNVITDTAAVACSLENPEICEACG